MVGSKTGGNQKVATGAQILGLQLRRTSRQFANEKAPTSRGLNRFAVTAYADVTFTVCLFKAPLVQNETVPLAKANKVWSLPIPTFTPG